VPSLDQWVTSLRGPKAAVDPTRAYASVWEEEADGLGGHASTAVVFITNRECPFRCVMCDLWTHTLDAPLPPGLVPGQIEQALATVPPARWVKLYNAGSFFDPGAIPAEDDAAIARVVHGYERVIVESHPAFLAGRHGDRCLRFRDAIGGRLEVAIGLETAHPDVLARLNKRMTIGTFRSAAAFLAGHAIDLRVFVLLNPPFLPADAAVEWACRSIDLAHECGARVCAVIPTRGGNGAMERLEPRPAASRLADLEAVLMSGLERRGLIVLADLWETGRLVADAGDVARLQRLAAMNRDQHARGVAARDADRL
jgi:hypothetical protein